MQNETLISFYYPKACQPETTATRFTTTQRPRTPSTTIRDPITLQMNSEFAMTTPPYILFLSFIYIKNVYSRREGYFGGVWMVW